MRNLSAVLAAVALISNPAAAQVMDAEEHRRPAQEPRSLAPPGTRTLIVALGTGHPARPIQTDLALRPPSSLIARRIWLMPVRGSGVQRRRPRHCMEGGFLTLSS